MICFVLRFSIAGQAGRGEEGSPRPGTAPVGGGGWRQVEGPAVQAFHAWRSRAEWLESAHHPNLQGGIRPSAPLPSRSLLLDSQTSRSVASHRTTRIATGNAFQPPDEHSMATSPATAAAAGGRKQGPCPTTHLIAGPSSWSVRPLAARRPPPQQWCPRRCQPLAASSIISDDESGPLHPNAATGGAEQLPSSSAAADATAAPGGAAAAAAAAEGLDACRRRQQWRAARELIHEQQHILAAAAAAAAEGPAPDRSYDLEETQVSRCSSSRATLVAAGAG